MKYAVVTFHRTLNPGATLQAYALCERLRRFGVDCDILDYRCASVERREHAFQKASSPLKTAAKRLLWLASSGKRRKQNARFFATLQNAGMLSAKAYDAASLNAANAVYDGFITGSDQVWNLNITENDWNFFLAFSAEEKRRYAFSASVGEFWPTEKNEKVVKLLKRYRLASARESMDVAALNEKFGLDFEHVCDPTMLLTADEWARLAVRPNESDYVLLYAPKTGVEKAAELYAKKHGKKLVRMGSGKVALREKKAPISVTCEEWLGRIANAAAVFTDSYHGLLFSLYFQKPVWSAYSGNRSSRQTSLFKRLDLRDCVYERPEDLERNIDYTVYTPRIDAFRRESEAFLQKMVEDMRG